MKHLFVVFIFISHHVCYGQTHDLNYFISQAQQNNPIAKDYQNQVAMAGLDSQLLTASLHTQVNFLSNNSYAPIIKGWGYDPAITNIANVSALIQANRNFLTRGNIAAQYRAISLQRRSLLDSLQLSQFDLVKTISDQYITTYGDLLLMDFNKEVFDLMQREEEALKKLTESSVYKQTDYLTFYVSMQQQELLYLQAEVQYNTDYLTLNYLSGIVDTTVERIAKPQITDTLHQNMYTSVFTNRFVTDSLRLENEKALIGYEYRPKIGAYTDAGFNSSMQYKPYRNFGFSAGLSVTIPIYDGHQREMKYSKIDIQERTRLANKEFFMNQYRQQLAQLRQQLYLTDRMVNKINRQIEYSHTLIIANGKLLETGDITMKDYVTAINNYLSAQNLLTQNNISRMRIINQINYWNR
ncbi:MAG: TolC family protein [Flavisolibacter sp.]